MLLKRLENTMHRCMECLEVGMKGKVQLLIEGAIALLRTVKSS